MAFSLEVSNNLDVLSAQLSAYISQHHEDVFVPVYIVTQTEGMDNYLRTQIAQRLGIAANIVFCTPSAFINKIYFAVGNRYSPTLEREPLTWLLFKILSGEIFQKNYADIAGYFDPSLTEADYKRMALATKLADIFDQYQVYRPELIKEWNAAILSGKAPGDWQEYLWQEAAELAGSTMPDKTKISTGISEKLKDSNAVEDLQKKFSNVYFFGLSVITKYHLEILHHLSRHIGIHFLLINPAPGDYWFDEQTDRKLAFLVRIKRLPSSAVSAGNQLLLSWGKVLQDTFTLLFDEVEILNGYDELEQIAPGRTSLLKNIQSDIFENKRIDEPYLHENMLHDRSISIHSCHSPVREIESLYNFLISLIAKENMSLSARDVVVMVSDIDTYAPYIRAVFDNVQHKMPYRIADAGIVNEDSVSAAVQSILRLSEKNFSADAVFRLLDFPAVRDQFGFTDMPFLKNVIAQAGIRRGLQGNAEDDSHFVSWAYGMKKLMYGIIMKTEAVVSDGVSEFVPVDMVEGQKSLEIVRLMHFVDKLSTMLAERDIEKPVSGWVSYVEKIIEDFISKQYTGADDFVLLQGQLQGYNVIEDVYSAPIIFDLFKHSFLDRLNAVAYSKDFAAGGITFCSLIPMRSIPFRVVAMLGLNFDKFPRKERAVSFNKMEKNRKRGDRNVKENDKHLFLETLLSAGEYFYVSYLGQSQKDNSAIPASALVDELVGYIERCAVEQDSVRSYLIVKHPLHNFSSKYNSEDPRLINYIAQPPSDLKIEYLDFSTGEDLSAQTVGLDQLISFLSNPIKGYFNRALGIYYEDLESELPENEVFELDHLESYFLNQDMLLFEHTSKELSDEYVQRIALPYVRSGVFPLENMASLKILNSINHVSAVKGAFDKLRKGHLPVTMHRDFLVGKTKISCAFRDVYDDKIISVSLSKKDIGGLIKAYITHLANAASGAQLPLYFGSLENKTFYKAKKISTDEALSQLTSLMSLFRKSVGEIAAFHKDFVGFKSEIQPEFDLAMEKYFDNENTYPDAYMLRAFQEGYLIGAKAHLSFLEYMENIVEPANTFLIDY